MFTYTVSFSFTLTIYLSADYNRDLRTLFHTEGVQTFQKGATTRPFEAT